MQAANSLLYARSFYLDAMAENWDALILNDYEAVMPLPWRKKWGIVYYYQPAFSQQAGIFSAGNITEALQQSFLTKLTAHARFAEITLNHAHPLETPENWDLTARKNYKLSLRHSHESLSKKYDSIAVKNIRRAINAGLSYAPAGDYATLVSMYREAYADRLPSFVPADFDHFLSVCDHLSAEDNLVIRKIFSRNNELLAGVVLLRDKHRLYNIISVVTTEGKYEQANYFMYDQLIREFSNSDLLLDFEGSEVKGIADFYSRFGTETETYPFARYNRLPWPIRLVKP